MFIAAIAALLAGPGDPDCGALFSRLESTDPRDPAALLDLGAECEARGCPRLARSAYERVEKLELAPGAPERCEAAFRLARIEIQARRHDAAFAILRRLTAQCPDHAAARSLLDGAETEKTREQILSVEKGDAAARAGRHAEALGHYEKAYALTPPEETASPYFPRAAILAKIAACRAELDAEKYRREYLPRTRSVRPCPSCKGSAARGFIPCAACGGKGKVEVPKKGSMMTGTSREKVLEPCPDCNGYGYRGCGECYALGYVAGEITPKEKKALRELALSVSEPRVFEKPLAGALAEVEEALLTIKEGATLNYLRAMQPEYVLSGPIRRALGPLLVGSKAPEAAQAEWAKASSDKRIRINFLLDYACEFSEYLRHFEILRGNRKPIPRRWNAPGPWTGSVLTPELLAAFPEEAGPDAVAVEGSFEGYEEGGLGEHKGFLKIAGEVPHEVVFFVWLPSAKAHLERLSRSSWKRSAEGLAEAYPFDLGSRLAREPKGHRAVAIGRFLQDPFAYPRNWFEVWRFERGLSNSQHAALRALKDRIDLSFPPRSPGEISRLFRDWFDLEIAFDPVFEREAVSANARDCPKGLVVDAIARSALGAEWYFEDGRVVVCAPGAKPPSADAAIVAERLKALREPGSWVVATKGSRSAGDSWFFPEDAAGLRVVARQAVLEMRYDVAERCFEALESAPGGSARERESLGAIRAKMRLLHRLTARTPVSRLAGAPELAEIVYQKPSGDLVGETVILTRGGELWTVEEAYGASFRIRPELVKRVEQVSPADWRRRKAEELERRAAGLERAGPRELPLRLFLLALFAKAHGFPARGAAYLERALELGEFEGFLSRFFPEEAAELSQLWRRAASREPLAAAASEERAAFAAPAAVAGPEKELWDAARQHALAASACARKVFEAEDAPAWRRKAVENLERAESAAARILEGRADDPDALRLQSEIRALKAACVEDLGFLE